MICPINRTLCAESPRQTDVPAGPSSACFENTIAETWLQPRGQSRPIRPAGMIQCARFAAKMARSNDGLDEAGGDGLIVAMLRGKELLVRAKLVQTQMDKAEAGRRQNGISRCKVATFYSPKPPKTLQWVACRRAHFKSVVQQRKRLQPAAALAREVLFKLILAE